MNWLLFIPFAFLCGSIPFGFLIGKVRGLDIREHGSGNIGATNLGRVLGRPYFFLCFFLDMLKGLVPTATAGQIMGTLGTFQIEAGDAFWWLGVMFASVLGHMFTPWLGFRGGKGVATALGALVGVFPAMTVPAAGAMLVYMMVLLLWRYVSLGSCSAAAALPLWVWIVFAHEQTLRERQMSSRRMDWDRLTIDEVAMIKSDIANFGMPFFVVALILAILVIYKHRANLGRIARGQEPKLGESRTIENPAPSDASG